MTELKTNIAGVFHVWAQLEQALESADNMAEIYVQHFLPEDTDYNSSTIWKQAGQALYVILNKFCEQKQVSAFVGGKVIGDWMNDYAFNHKCEVRLSR